MGKENESNNTKKNEEEKYRFMTEQIKPIKKQRLMDYLEKIGFTLIVAIIFGGVSGIVFCQVAQYMSRGNSQETMLESTLPNETKSSKVVSMPAATTKRISKKREETITTTEIEDYKTVSEQIAKTGSECNHYIVGVRGTNRNENWYSDISAVSGYHSGVIFKESTTQYYILCPADGISNAKSVKVSLWDDTVVSGKVIGSNADLGISILTVQKAEITYSTKSTLYIAKFGGQSNLKLGNPVIALGNPNGVMYSIENGKIVNGDIIAQITDGEIPLYSTDIPYSEQGNGIVTNLKGRVIGITTTDYSDLTGHAGQAFIGIYKIQAIIENIINGKDSVYLGIRGCDVTEKIQEKQNLPTGVYISGVIGQSPAYEAGMRVADVITKINGTKVESLNHIQRILLSHTNGDKITVTIVRTSGKYEKTKRLKVTLR